MDVVDLDIAVAAIDFSTDDTVSLPITLTWLPLATLMKKGFIDLLWMKCLCGVKCLEAPESIYHTWLGNEEVALRAVWAISENWYPCSNTVGVGDIGAVVLSVWIEPAFGAGVVVLFAVYAFDLSMNLHRYFRSFALLILADALLGFD